MTDENKNKKEDGRKNNPGRPVGAKSRPGTKKTGPKSDAPRSAGRKKGKYNYETTVAIEAMHKVFRRLGGVKGAFEYYDENRAEFYKLYFEKFAPKELQLLLGEMEKEAEKPELKINLNLDSNNNKDPKDGG